MGRAPRIRARAGFGPPLRLDGLVRDLQALIPEATVVGGCFGHRLPHPRVIPREERHAFWRSHQERATQECLHMLLDMAGLPPVEPARLPSGARNWPKGHVGSVSHKGTRVVAALAREEDLQMVGIDIDDHREVDLPGTRPCEHPPTKAAPSSAILFSAKEAVFKALHPLVNRPLGHDDVVLSWYPPHGVALMARAYAVGYDLEVRCSLAEPSWVVSAAVRSPGPQWRAAGRQWRSQSREQPAQFGVRQALVLCITHC